ncbi:transporter substrate-binding domain-containing protein [Robbsia sp. KACC 23696]|uniref:transporter substrate-binding domain-containing protein n=1 Tax=Robbsia sp. KACC 23696 TaxID=3149231 RepID=UPI00325A7380
MKRLSLRLMLSATAALLTCTSFAAHADGLLEKIEKSHVIHIAVPTDYAPYGFVGPDMQPQGIDIDSARLIAQKLGVKLDLVPVTSPNRVAYLQTGKADITISSLGKTAERSKVIDYSIAYAPFFDAVFGKKDLAVSNFDDLNGKTISATKASMQDQEISDRAPKALIQRYDDNSATIQSFLSGQVQMMAIGTTVAAAIKKDHPNVDIALKVVLSNSPCYIGVPKGNPDLVNKLNEIIRAAKADGTIKAISMKWLGTGPGDLPE